jgi:hypothetical protein
VESVVFIFWFGRFSNKDGAGVEKDPVMKIFSQIVSCSLSYFNKIGSMASGVAP